MFKIFASSLIAMMLLSSCSQRVVEQPKESAPPVRLSAVYSTSDYVWVAGQGGIWRSSDRGSSWVKQHDTNLNVDSLFFVDDQHGWANEGETLLTTTTGGATWEVITAPSDRISDLRFVTPTIGHAVARSDSGRLIRSVDGGETWADLVTPTPIAHACFAMPDDGWMIGPANRVFYTTDGGESWVEKGAIPALTFGRATSPEQVMQVSCLSNSTLLALVSYGQGAGTNRWSLYQLTPGANWTRIASKLDQQTDHTLAKPFLLLPAGHDAQFLVGESAGWLSIEGTLKGSAEWQAGFIDRTSYQTTASATEKLSGYPLAGHFRDAKTGWLVVKSPSGTQLLLTEDGGGSWTPIGAPAESGT